MKPSTDRARRGHALHLQPLESRVLMTSEKLVTLDARDAEGDVFVTGGSVYSRDFVSDDKGERVVVARTSLSTGKRTALSGKSNNDLVNFDFHAAGRTFVSFYEGFGWVDDANNQVVRIEDRDAISGQGASNTARFLELGNTVSFFAQDPADIRSKERLWISDGTAKGTRRAELPEGADSGTNFVGVVNGRVYFTAQTFIGLITLWSIGPADAEARQEFDPRDRDADGQLRTVAPLGSDRMALQYQRGDSGKDTLLSLDAKRRVQTLDTGGVDDAQLVGWSVSDSLRTYQSPGGSSGALVIARTKDRGEELYRVRPDTLKLQRLSDLHNALTFKDVARVENTEHGPGKWIFIAQANAPAAPRGNFGPVATPQTAAFLYDAASNHVTQIYDEWTYDAVDTEQGVFFREGNDANLWRAGSDGTSTPVAAGIAALHVSNGTLVLQGESAGRFRRLRDVNPIIAGSAFADTDGDRVRDATERPLAETDRLVWLDKNRDGRLDKGEPTSPLSGMGTFAFDGLKAGTYDVRIQEKSWTPSKGSASVARTTVGTRERYRPARFALRDPLATVKAVVWDDADDDRRFDTSEWTANVDVFIDENKDGAADRANWTGTPSTSSPGSAEIFPFATIGGVPKGTHTLGIRWRRLDGTTRVIWAVVTLAGGENYVYLPV